MEGIPLSVLAGVLVVLLVVSGFFAMSETAMMASNRYRLQVLAQNGHRGARLAIALLARTDRLLGVILLFNTVINAAIATLAGLITVELFGEEKWALGAGTVAVSFLILVFAEITPKVVGAAYPDRLATASSYIVTPILRISQPVIEFVNLFVRALLRLLRLKLDADDASGHLSHAELRAMVLESSRIVPSRHRDILLNLFDLEGVTVEDVMAPRSEIEAIDLAAPMDEIRSQLATSYHTRLPVYEGDPGNVIGILHQRRLLGAAMGGELDAVVLRDNLADPYFVPAATKIFDQLRFFQENRQRVGLVVDEYGEVLGLVTLEDIVEEIVGKFTTSVPDGGVEMQWDGDGYATVEGSRPLREVNRRLRLDLPLDGPKTLNGLILEYLQDIPEAGVSLRLGGIRMEIMQVEDRRIKRVRVFRPEETAPPAA